MLYLAITSLWRRWSVAPARHARGAFYAHDTVHQVGWLFSADSAGRDG
jgi:hypothetical protein